MLINRLSWPMVASQLNWKADTDKEPSSCESLNYLSDWWKRDIFKAKYSKIHSNF